MTTATIRKTLLALSLLPFGFVQAQDHNYAAIADADEQWGLQNDYWASCHN